MPTIGLNNKRYNYLVDVDRGRVWLEDNETKHQWQWCSENPPPLLVRDGKQVPQRVFLDALKLLFDKGDISGRSGRVRLKRPIDNKDLELVVDISLAITNWRLVETLVLAQLPLQEIDILSASLRDLQTKCAALEGMVVYCLSVLVCTVLWLLMTGMFSLMKHA